MNIYAAIDLKNGNCVRLIQGDPNAETVYGNDPAAMAKKWVGLGTDWLHIVNLDGAFGDPEKAAKNVQALKSILDSVDVPIQFGGGLRSEADIQQALDLGVKRVIIGSMAANHPEKMEALLAKFGPERIVLGLDVKDGAVATHGWLESSGLDPVALAQRFHALGLSHIIHTDISRDGMLTGANVESSVALAQEGRSTAASHPLQVIVSGGVADLEDVKRVKATEQNGIDGMIIGKAIYTGKIDLAKAMEIAKGA